MQFVHRLEDLDQESLPLAGGKGANLGAMVRAGLQVPPGFVLATAAYRLFVAASGIQGEIIRLAAGVDPARPATAEQASDAIRELLHRQPVPEPIRQELLAAWGELGAGPVAVRSSATAEDLPGASFAGQQESYLNVRDEAALVESVRRCWSSLWTPRAIAYRARQGIAPADVSLAVVVQRLVAAEAAGILFTANPVNGRRDQMVIDGAWGLGEAVVSGQVTPDQWILDHAAGDVVEARPARKEVMTVRTDAGTDLAPVSADLQERPVLDAAGVKELAGLGRRVAGFFGCPQDIEWALAGGRFYLVQSRPITSLFPLPHPEPPPGAGLRVYVCFNYIQGFPEPFTPLGLSAFRIFARGPAAFFGFRLPPGTDPPAFTAAASRIYVDLGSALRHPGTRRVALTIPEMVDRPMVDIFRLLVEREPELSPPNPPLPLKRPTRQMLPAAWRALVALVAPELGRRMARAAAVRLVRREHELARAARSVPDRIRFFEEQGPGIMRKLVRYILPAAVPGLAARFLAERKLKQWLGDASPLQPILRSLPHNPTTEMDLALWRISRRLRAEGSALSADHPAVREFLAVYGHRGLREIDIGMPRWRDDPAPVLAVLANYLNHDEGADAEAHFRRGAETAERAAAELTARVGRKKGWLRATFLRFLLNRIRALAGLREFPKFTAVRIFAIYRDVAAGAGAELVRAGRLDRADDVFFLDLRDWESDKDLRALAAANRAEYQRELERKAVPRVITSTGEVFFTAAKAPAGALTGTPASIGVHEGRVRVIHDPRGAHLEPGEILVAPGTDPAWTPLFLTAGALVMEIGGIMSHGSVVAREYGIPAVVGVTGATTRLRTGQRVRVDGEAGLVIPLE